ncbi:GNAT family N-acetyltransferase [Robertkochia aurantiaca]|uniref:GNAT family N-acetyltransferase n=1 Tax=Robertkochia aurantiaca TaxID=2873700 RepID=UPI001CCD569B|nr:GNAT family N-acetyltransferase [Robertkochia sp. 3YJGBD-33]
MFFRPLDLVTTEQLLECFNLSFRDYSIPLQLSKEQLLAKIQTDMYRPEVSVGAFDGTQLVGFILHGADDVNGKTVLYNGGTGVIPEYRGENLSCRMYDYLKPQLLERGVYSIRLEVISDNIPAIRSYESCGFKTSRALNCYRGEVSLEQLNENIRIGDLIDADWEYLYSFWDTIPTWQNSSAVLKDQSGQKVRLGAWYGDTLVGYLIYDPESCRLQQIGVKKDFRRQKIAATLVANIINDHQHSLTVINVDTSADSLNGFFRSMELEKILEQKEMIIMMG